MFALCIAIGIPLLIWAADWSTQSGFAMARHMLNLDMEWKYEFGPRGKIIALLALSAVVELLIFAPGVPKFWIMVAGVLAMTFYARYPLRQLRGRRSD